MSSTLTPHMSPIGASGLQRLLNTCDAAAFLRDYIGEQMLHVAGERNRWSDLFSWQELNAALNSGFIPHPRMRLVKEGAEVDVARYTVERSGRQWPESQRCHQLMSEGATLILMNIESINPRIEAFVRELERDLSADVRVDVIATCASTPGLKMHWDNAECFNVQIDGEKLWKVTRPERPYPLTSTTSFPHRKDVVKPTAPEGASTWEGKLVPGDLIYLPRGWWHAVTPHVTPSLHLSFAIDIPTLSDFLYWFAEDAVRHESARRSLGVWQSADERREAITQALASVASALSPDAVETYLTRFASAAAVRPDFALPAAAAPGSPHLGPQTRMRLLSAKPISWALEGDQLTFDWRGQAYRFHAQVLPVLRKLETMNPQTLEELSEGTNRLVVRAFVLALLTAGLLTVTDRPRASEL
jgi:ribosomal protein L16 Arg81 hydroxylase